MARALKVAVQMDPIQGIDIDADSTFALMLEAQKRGHALWHYHVRDLTFWAGRVAARAHPVEVERKKGAHWRFGDEEELDLSTMDVVLMRQDPPFDMAYITATHILEHIHPKTLVVNDPASVRNAPEKMWMLDYERFMPPTLITRELAEARAFLAEHGEIVVKPLHGNGGKAIFKVDADGTNLSALFEVFNQTWPEAHMVQPFIPEVSLGDKRIVLVDGEFAGAINRRPGEGEFRSNLARGGYAEAAGLTPQEEEICAAMGHDLKARGLVFVGIDVIGGKWLTEINVTSPTGIVAIDAFNGTDTGGRIWDALERRHAAMDG